ncbi:Na+/melibiose symporter-like transporter [Luteococcus japonicus]|uniref:Multidrug efflux pump Tap n=1 Tax=Luteococcus japonicus TaxID=33984 RepID=A0A3N1ZWR9_9ACTN|nr:Na+/melibiose symporter-like transporter [Luteococcus japonicus]
MDVTQNPSPTRTRGATFPIYLAASAASLFGNAAINIVLPWLVLERTGNPSLAGTVAAVSAVPSAIAALAGGHLIDRFGRRRMSVLADIGSAASVAALAVVDRLTGLDLTWFIVLGITGALFDLPGMTARETLMANVSHTSGRSVDAIAGARQGVFGLSFLLGPAIAGLLLTWLPAIGVVWITAACSASAAVLIAVMPLTPMPEDPSPEENPLGALATVRRSRPLTLLIVLNVISTLLVAPLLAVLLPAHFQAMGRPDRFGLSMSAFAIGTVLGGGVYAGLLKTRRLVAWVAGNLFFLLSFLLIAPMSGFWLPALGMLVAGIGQGIQGPIVSVLLTEHVPERLRGRIFGLLTSLGALASPVGLGLMAVLLAGHPLRVGGWALATAWAPVAIWACLSPGLRGWLVRADDQ